MQPLTAYRTLYEENAKRVFCFRGGLACLAVAAAPTKPLPRQAQDRQLQQPHAHLLAHDSLLFHAHK
jgi:hypothetical protein